MNDQLIKSAFGSIASEAGPARGDWLVIERKVRRDSFVKKSVVAIVSIAVIVAAVVVVPRLGTAERPGGLIEKPLASSGPDSLKYIDEDYRFQVSYPSTWMLGQPSLVGVKLASPSTGSNGGVIVAILRSPGMPYTYHGCQAADEEYVTASSSTETIAGTTALRCEQVVSQYETQQHRVTYSLDWTGRPAPGSPPCRAPNSAAAPCGDQDSLSFVIAAPTSEAWSAYGAAAEEIVHSLVWLT